MPPDKLTVTTLPQIEQQVLQTVRILQVYLTTMVYAHTPATTEWSTQSLGPEHLAALGVFAISPPHDTPSVRYDRAGLEHTSNASCTKHTPLRAHGEMAHQ